MKIKVIVSDFPKVTETFAVANVLHYLEAGHDAEVFHLKPFRKNELVHEHAVPVVARAFGLPWIGGASGRALFRVLLRRPNIVFRHILRVFSAFWRNPRHLAASLVLMPKSLALGLLCREDGTDHIHAEFAGYPATAALLASEICGRPFSFSSHAHDIFITQGLLVKKAKAAAFVRTISEFNNRFLQDLDGFPSDRIRVIRCGIDPGCAPLPPALRPKDRALRILFVGSLYPRKGVNHLITAVSLLEGAFDYEVRILGDGPCIGELRALAEELVPGQIQFDGAQKADAVHRAYDWADVVVTPSVTGEEGRSEGIPVVLMEALAHGCAVIASRLSGIPELVEDGSTGILTEPGDSAAIADALRQLNADPDHALALGAAGRARVLTEYNINKNAADLLTAMKECT